MGTQRYAALTGDLIGSRKLEPALRGEVLDWIRSLAGQFAELHPGAVVGGLEVFRGDSWQLCLANPALALTAAVFLRAGTKAHPSRAEPDMRIGIGIGTVESLRPERVSQSHGEAFALSGTALDALADSERRLGLAGPASDAPLRVLGRLAAPLLDLHLSRWTRPESAAVYGALMGWTQAKTAQSPIARKPDGSPLTQQAVHDALKRIRWSSHVEPVIEAAEKELKRERE